MIGATTVQAKHHQIIILGAGPGGIQLGYFLDRAKLDYAVLDRASAPGSFFEQHPVHRTLLSINKINTGHSDSEKNLRWDWNSLIAEDFELLFKKYDQDFFPQAESLMQYLHDFCVRSNIRVYFNHLVISIDKKDDRFLLRTASSGDFTCDILIIGTGMSVPVTPKIKGIDLAESYLSHDRSAKACTNKDILILGKGNSAFETATALSQHAARVHLISPGRLRFAWQTHFPGHLRQINSPFMETYLLKQQNAVLNGLVDTIERSGDKLRVDITWENGDHARHIYDRVILCTGFMFDVTPFSESVKPELVHDSKLPALTYNWESTNISSLFFCGSLMQANDYKKSASAFVHGIRYNCRTLSKILKARIERRQYPSANVSLNAEALLTCIYNRLSYSSSLWHMHGSLSDAYIFDQGNACFRLMMDVPVGMIAQDQEIKLSSRIEFQFTFENPQNPSERAKFTPGGLIHPALFFYLNGEFFAECHMYEDVYAEWEREAFGFCFDGPVSKYLASLLAAGVTPTKPIALGTTEIHGLN